MTLSEIREMFRTTHEIVSACRDRGNVQPEKVLQRKIYRYAMPHLKTGSALRIDPVATANILFDPAAADQIVAKITANSPK